MKSKKKLIVNLFKVVPTQGSRSLDDLLSEISGTHIDQRVRDLGAKVRVDDEILGPSGSQRYWLLDFVRLRFDGGPGRASVAAPTRSFDLQMGEGFSEETAMLYDPKTGYAIVQYNHFGPRASTIAEYLSVFDRSLTSSYDLRVQLRGDAQARLNRKKIFTKIALKVAPANLSDSFRRNNVSMATMLDQQANNFDGDIVTIEVALDRQKSNTLRLTPWIKAIRGLAAENDKTTVKHLVISGRDNEYEKIEPIDLLAEKLELGYHGVEMDSGLRYIRTERYSRLIAAFNQWTNERVIT